MTGTAALISEESDSLNQVEHIKSNHRKVLDIIPGVSGGMARVLVGQPFDTIKTRMQVLGAGTIGAQGMPESMVYKNNMDCMRKMITNEGPMSLYKGTVAPLLGNMVLLGIHFPTFQKVRKMLDKDGEYKPTNVLIAGGAAGAAGSLVSCSSELIRTKMQMQRKAALMAQIKGTPLSANGQETYNSSIDCVRKIFRHHGIRGLFSGYASTLARDIQGYAWFFLGYEATVQAFLKHNHAPGATKADLSFLEVLSAGIVAGFGLWGSMFPIDTIKSKIQADSLANPQFKGTIDCIRQSVAHEGAMGLWRGVGVALLRAIPVNGAIFLAVEGARKLVDDVSDHIDGWETASAPQAMPASQAAPAMGSQTATA